jgi:hypothetical protein
MAIAQPKLSFLLFLCPSCFSFIMILFLRICTGYHLHIFARRIYDPFRENIKVKTFNFNRIMTSPVENKEGFASMSKQWRG